MLVRTSKTVLERSRSVLVILCLFYSPSPSYMKYHSQHGKTWASKQFLCMYMYDIWSVTFDIWCDMWNVSPAQDYLALTLWHTADSPGDGDTLLFLPDLHHQKYFNQTFHMSHYLEHATVSRVTLHTEHATYLDSLKSNWATLWCCQGRYTHLHIAHAGSSPSVMDELTQSMCKNKGRLSEGKSQY